MPREPLHRSALAAFLQAVTLRVVPSTVVASLPVPSPTLRLLGLLDVVVIVTALLFHEQFLAVCLDREQARLEGIPILRAETGLLVLVALTVITLTTIVGLLLVIALLSLPAATAVRPTRSLLGGSGLSIVICAVVTMVPRVAVYGTPIGPEPAIILAAGAVYGLSYVLPRAPTGPLQVLSRSR